MGAREDINRLSKEYMRDLINELSNKVRVKLDDAAYDAIESFYKDYSPHYYRRTRNFKYYSYSNAVVSQNQNHKTGGFTKNISITFSPDDMRDVYFESEWDGHKYVLTDTPVPKELIFENSFIYGLHGLTIESESDPPIEIMKDKVEDTYKWLNSKNVDNIIGNYVNRLTNESINLLAKSMSGKVSI